MVVLRFFFMISHVKLIDLGEGVGWCKLDYKLIRCWYGAKGRRCEVSFPHLSCHETYKLHLQLGIAVEVGMEPTNEELKSQFIGMKLFLELHRKFLLELCNKFAIKPLTIFLFDRNIRIPSETKTHKMRTICKSTHQ